MKLEQPEGQQGVQRSLQVLIGLQKPGQPLRPVETGEQFLVVRIQIDLLKLIEGAVGVSQETIRVRADEVLDLLDRKAVAHAAQDQICRAALETQ